MNVSQRYYNFIFYYRGVVLLPGLTSEGYRAILCTLPDPDPSKFKYTEFVKLYAFTIDFSILIFSYLNSLFNLILRYNMALDYWVARDGITEGFAIILDMDGAKLAHLTKINIAVLRKFIFYVQVRNLTFNNLNLFINPLILFQEAFPIRLREIHFIKIPSFMDKLMAMMTPFMKKELMNMLHLHKTLDTFIDKFVPKEMMPDKYGGKAGNLEKMIRNVYEDIQSNGQFFIDEEATKRVNENLRPGKPKTERDLFGYFFTLFSSTKKAHEN